MSSKPNPVADLTEQERVLVIHVSQTLMQRDHAYHTDMRNNIRDESGPALVDYVAIYNSAAAFVVKSAKALALMTSQAPGMTPRDVCHWIRVLLGLDKDHHLPNPPTSEEPSEYTTIDI